MSIFTPYVVQIDGISQSLNAVVSFIEDHAFKVGEIISLRSSRPFGMWEVNNKQCKVLATTSDTVTVDLDTTNYTAFFFPPVGEVQFVAVAVPSGSGVIPGSVPATVTLFDVFDNVPTS